MQISAFPSVRDTTPERVDVTWSLFSASLAISFEHDTKRDLPLWSAATFDGNRTNDAVVSVAMLVLDIDVEHEDTVLAFAERMSKYDSVLHTTWSHLRKYRCPHCDGGHELEEPSCTSKRGNTYGFPVDDRTPAFSARAIIRLTRPVRADEWSEFWDAAVAFLQAPADLVCKDASRAYYVPAAPPGTEPEQFVLRFSGISLDVDQLMTYERTPEPPKPTEALSRARFERFAKTMARKTSDHLSEIGERLLRVTAGEPFADPGERDVMVFRMSTLLAERFPYATPESIAQHFTLSLDRMSHEPEPLSVRDVTYKINRAQQAILTQRAHEQQDENVNRRRRIQEAFRNGRSEPYAPDEHAPPQRWVVQLGNSYYFWLDGGYEGPYTSRDARAAAVRDLMPAYNVVSLYETDAKGRITPKPLEKLVTEYGTVAHASLADLRAQKSHYVEQDRAIIEAPCPIRPLTPTYDHDVAAYLELIGGDRHDDLLTWIAAITLLDRPCAALFLVGPKGSGKSLFAYGHARIWTTERPTYLDEALADFNDALLRCPLVLADEAIPRDFRGHARNAELRHHIQAVTRPLNRKFLPSSTLLGATRTIVAANNEEVLATPESLSNYDIEAIAARYFYRPLTEELCYFLADKNPRDNGWVNGDKIAKHALWLGYNHEWSSDERFIIEPTDMKLHRSLTVRSGPRGSICQWLVGFLLDPNRFKHDGRANDYVVVDEGELLVNVQGLAKCWNTYVLNEPCPPTGKLASALGALCTTSRRQLRIGGKKINFRTVNLDNLVAWAEQHGYADEDTIREALVNIMNTAKALVN